MLQQTPALSPWEEQAVGREMSKRKGYAAYLPCLLWCSPQGRCPRCVVLFHNTGGDDFYGTAVPSLAFEKFSGGAQPLQRVPVKPLCTESAPPGQEEQMGEQRCTKIWNVCFRVAVSGDVSVLGTSPVRKVKSSFASALIASKRKACDQ